MEEKGEKWPANGGRLGEKWFRFWRGRMDGNLMANSAHMVLPLPVGAATRTLSSVLYKTFVLELFLVAPRNVGAYIPITHVGENARKNITLLSLFKIVQYEARLSAIPVKNNLRLMPQAFL
ncbi:hypothetical protein IEQ34_021843 [Dendrobium chrysotoxum]|uniref:Uncharacterized protein n=1 Tax=Dendrobium chrysotoxum TaxID=161865 RepID=A0AAV7FX89_DENCH|nr:hypothetical protein IEQ34_021843 [Dendrobium chrysotoxum]